MYALASVPQCMALWRTIMTNSASASAPPSRDAADTSTKTASPGERKPHPSIQPYSGHLAPDPTPEWMTDKGSSAGDGGGTGMGTGTEAVKGPDSDIRSGTNPVTGVNAGTGIGQEDVSAHGKTTEDAVGGRGSSIDSDKHGRLVPGKRGGR